MMTKGPIRESVMVYKDKKWYDRWFGLIVAGVTVIVIVTFLANYLPTAVAHTVQVTYNGTHYAVRSDATVAQDVASIDPSMTAGNLVDVTGVLLKKGAGAAPTYTVNGVSVAPTATVEDGAVIAATKGHDVTEPLKTVSSARHVGYTRHGVGPLVTVSVPGTDTIVETQVGAQSGKKVKEAQTVTGSKPLVSYERYRTNKDKIVALTFDDGPNPGETDKIVAILKKYGVRGTFFMVGSEVTKHPATARTVALAGNQVAVHAYTHHELTRQTPHQIDHQIMQTARTITAATGVKPTWMRPPYGAVDGTVYDEVARCGFKVALWGIDTRDWSRPGTKHIIHVAKHFAYPGAVILMHDGGGNRKQTVAALPHIIAFYKRSGYRFVTIEEYYARLHPTAR